jgi:hypothetical protein
MLRGTNDSGGSRQWDDVAARYGFRRVEHVHIRINNGDSSATVLAIAHRYPRSIRVPLAVAMRLVAAGAPATIERAAPPEQAVAV